MFSTPASAQPKMIAAVGAAAGSLPVSDLWTANLELPVCLLGVVLPKDFNRCASGEIAAAAAVAAVCKVDAVCVPAGGGAAEGLQQVR
jgi:hypothetical protein